MVDVSDDFDAERTPTPLERLPWPFELDDNLAEPFASFVVIRLTFETPMISECFGELERILNDWITSNRTNQGRQYGSTTTGEVVQVGHKTVEYQVLAAYGDPDTDLVSLLRGLAAFSRSRQQILRVEMD